MFRFFWNVTKIEDGEEITTRYFQDYPPEEIDRAIEVFVHFYPKHNFAVWPHPEYSEIM